MSHVAPSSHSHPFDTALRAYSRHAVDFQEARSEPGIRVAEGCLVISGICFYGRGEIDSAPRSCCGLREKTPPIFKFNREKYNVPLFSLRTALGSLQTQSMFRDAMNRIAEEPDVLPGHQPCLVNRQRSHWHALSIFRRDSATVVRN